MAELIVIAFDDEAPASDAYSRIQRLQRDLRVDLAGLALITVDAEGRVQITTPGPGGLVAVGAASSGFFGVLLGLLFFSPVRGIEFGGLMGALLAGLDRTGLNSEFRQRVQNSVGPGRSAVVAYAMEVSDDAVAAALAPLGGDTITASLADSDERTLIDELKVTTWLV